VHIERKTVPGAANLTFFQIALIEGHESVRAEIMHGKVPTIGFADDNILTVCRGGGEFAFINVGGRCK
jgi:hypothetical protein